MNSILKRAREQDGQLDYLMSSRSTLYNLEPIAIGTSYVESLTSYIARLALKHNVNVGSLMKGVFACTSDKTYLKNNLSEGIFGATPKYINGNSRLSIEYVNVLEQLTSRNDIHHLTMNNWTGIFTKNVVGEYRRWCPICLDEWASNSKEIYEPLIWYISAIKKCDVHENVLRESCPNCYKKLPYIHSNFVAGYCQYCFTWLGVQSQEQVIEPLYKGEKFILESYKQLIEKSSYVSHLPSKKSISLSLKKIMNVLKLNSTQFAKFLGVSPSTLSLWLNNKHTPLPEKLIEIAWKINCTLYDLIYSENLIGKIRIDNQILSNINKGVQRGGYIPKLETERHLKNEITVDEPKSLNQLAAEKGFSPTSAKDQFPDLCKKLSERYAHREKDIRNEKLKEIETKLKFELTQEPPLSLAKSLEKYGYPRITVKRYFPELCKRLVLRHKKYKEKLKIERTERVKEEIKNIVLDIHKRGEYPYRKRVQRYLKQPAVFKNPIYRDYWKEIISNLGYVLH